MGWRRNLAQSFFVRLERLQERSLQIVPGTPLARTFRAFGEGSRIQAPQLFLVGAHATSLAVGVHIRKFFALEVHAPLDATIVTFADGVQVGHYVRFLAINGIHVGRDAGIGHGVTIADTVHDHKTTDEAGWRAPLVVGRPLVIGDRAWIGNNCIVAGGLTIGEGAIVAPNSFVNADVEAHTMVGGNPARPLKRKDPSTRRWVDLGDAPIEAVE
ncbi:MAG: acyltransferase [Actinobacteria bacterium]|nr:acyltransferase [Actinomycetota bacterium]